MDFRLLNPFWKDQDTAEFIHKGIRSDQSLSTPVTVCTFCSRHSGYVVSFHLEKELGFP